MEFRVVNRLMKIKDGVPVLQGAYGLDEDDFGNEFPEKNLLDAEDYDVCEFANNAYTVTHDENGDAYFNFTGSTYAFSYTRENGFSIEFRSVPDIGQFRGVFVIHDVYGNRHNSAFISFE